MTSALLALLALLAAPREPRWPQLPAVVEVVTTGYRMDGMTIEAGKWSLPRAACSVEWAGGVK